jgi:hypothetical protein
MRARVVLVKALIATVLAVDSVFARDLWVYEPAAFFKFALGPVFASFLLF